MASSDVKPPSRFPADLLAAIEHAFQTQIPTVWRTVDTQSAVTTKSRVVRAFMTSLRRFPDSGLAQRYAGVQFTCQSLEAEPGLWILSISTSRPVDLAKLFGLKTS